MTRAGDVNGGLDRGAAIRERPPPRKVFCSALIRSLAPVCPASHEGEVRKLIFHRDFSRASVHSAVRFSSKAELSIRQGAPCKPHIRREDIPPRSRIRDGRAPIGAAPLCGTALSHQAGQRRHPPWIGRPMLLRSQGSTTAAIRSPDSQLRLPAPRPASRTAIRQSEAGAPSPLPLLCACDVPCRQRVRETS
jgi:hypothetical protein